MAFFDWEESFELGIKELDEHHRYLVYLCNQTFDCRGRGSCQETLAGIIDKLVDYSRYHFAAEEAWMRLKRYPDLQLHRDEHRNFTSLILGFRDEFQRGNRELSSDLLTFLKGMLFNHILYEDFKLKKISAPS